MNLLVGRDNFQHPFFFRTRLDLNPWLKQAPSGARHEAVSIEKVFFQLELWIPFLQIACPVMLYSMTQNQVLSPRWGSNRIGLYKTDALDRLPQRRRLEQRRRYGMLLEMSERQLHRLQFRSDRLERHAISSATLCEKIVLSVSNSCISSVVQTGASTPCNIFY